jgi:hypothetical protein
MAFGTQWRDLLDDTSEAFVDRGFQTHKLPPAGYKLPVVNDCLIFVWRCPDTVNAISQFASSPTRKNGFAAPHPDPMLFEPSLINEAESIHDVSKEAELERVVRGAGDSMPLVLVMVQSSPLGLQSIEWAVAELDEESDTVKLHGQEIIWEPEVIADAASSSVEPFDSGAPNTPIVEPRKQEGTQPDA